MGLSRKALLGWTFSAKNRAGDEQEKVPLRCQEGLCLCLRQGSITSQGRVSGFQAYTPSNQHGAKPSLLGESSFERPGGKFELKSSWAIHVRNARSWSLGSPTAPETQFHPNWAIDCISPNLFV